VDIRIHHRKNSILIDPIGRSRYNNLGGDDIDRDLAVFLLACWEYESECTLTDLKPDIRKELYRLFLKKAEAFKVEVEERIAEGMELNEFVIQETLEGDPPLTVSFRRNMPKELYDEVTGRYFQERSDVNIYRPIGQAIAVAQEIHPTFTEKKLNLILFTGGASRMAAVGAALVSRNSNIRRSEDELSL